MRTLIPLAMLLAASCDEFPRINESADVPGTVLSGQVLVDSEVELAPTVLLLSAEDDPMPPLGTGFPITFAAIGPERFNPRATGLSAADYALTDLDPGGVYLVGVMDLDANFHPEVTALATPSCGDYIGWHTDGEGEPSPITLGANEWIDGVTVGPLVELDSPDPAFTLTDEFLGLNQDFGMISVEVLATFADTMRVSASGPWSGGTTKCAASFLYERIDADGDGVVDTNPLVPLYENRWPQVVLQWLGDPIDTDNDGAPDDFDRGEDEDVFIAAIGIPKLADGEPEPAPGEVVRTAALQVTFSGLGQRFETDGSVLVLAGTDLPNGAWGVIVITKAGQIWTLPNEIDDTLAMSKNLPPPGLTSEGDPSQGVWMTLDL